MTVDSDTHRPETSLSHFLQILSLTHITLPSFGKCTNETSEFRATLHGSIIIQIQGHILKVGEKRRRRKMRRRNRGVKTQWREGSEEGGTKRVRNWEDYVAKVKVDSVDGHSESGGRMDSEICILNSFPSWCVHLCARFWCDVQCVRAWDGVCLWKYPRHLCFDTCF